jgi:CRP-like cAMP-binding protein
MPLKELAAFLSQSSAFAGLPAREIDALARVAQEERHPARAYVFTEGDPARWFYLVKVGHVKILRQAKTGKDVVLRPLGPGEVFGGVAVIGSRTRVEPPGHRYQIFDPMIALADRYPLRQGDGAMIGRRLTAHDSVKSLAVDPVEARLAAAVLRLAEREARKAGQRDLALSPPRQSLAT